MDLEDVKGNLVSCEFIAVILAGFGNQLVPLTSDYGDESCPKALLPVANKPMIDFILSWIEQSGIKDVLLICPAIHRAAIYHHIHSDVSSPNMNIDLQTYDETMDDSVGTCTLLRHFAHRIQKDFVLIPCDFIAPPSLPLNTLLNQFRADSGSSGSIVTSCWYAIHKPEKSASPEEWGPVPTPTSIVWDNTSGTLLHIDTVDDVDKNSNELEFRMSLLSKHPNIRLSSNFQDSHVYVCIHSVLNVLSEKRHLESFREEFLPWLCKVQYQKLKRRKYGLVLCPDSEMPSSQGIALQHSTLLVAQEHRSGVHNRDAELSSPTTDRADEDVSASLKVGLLLHRSVTEPAFRINNIHSFVEINRRSLANAHYVLPTDPKNRAMIDQKAQISSDTIVGDSTSVSEKTAIKKSIIGRHCIIGKMVKIVGCILLDHCVVEDGAKIEGCVLGKNTKIGAKAELFRCVTQAGYEVSAGDIIKSEKLEATDWAAAPGESEDEEDNNLESSDQRSIDM